MVKEPGYYKWSSYNGYLNEKDVIAKVLDTEVILGMFSDNIQTARRVFVEHMNNKNIEPKIIYMKDV